MADTYFWIESGEDGIGIRPMSKRDIEKELAARTGDDINEDSHPHFLAHMPGTWDGHFDAAAVGDSGNAVVIIKGEIIAPRKRQVVTKWEV